MKREGDLDGAMRVGQHLVVFKAGVQLRTSIAANLGDAVSGYIPALLDARYPRPSRFGEALTKARLEKSESSGPKRNLTESLPRLQESSDKKVGPHEVARER